MYKHPEDGARAPKHVAAIIILFSTKHTLIFWCNNKYQLIKNARYEYKNNISRYCRSQ